MTQTEFCGDKSFVATKDVYCGDQHVFAATKTILVRAPANGSIEAGLPALSEERRVRSVGKILGFAKCP